MSHHDLKQQQDQNAGKLVMNTFYTVARKDGVTAKEIAQYLQEKYGDLWRFATLVGKAEETLKRSAILGFLERRGDRYVSNLAREMGCGRRRRKRSCGRRRRRRRRSRRRRRRRSCRRRRRRSRRRRSRRRSGCCCK